jgi:toxin HigB-1
VIDFIAIRKKSCYNALHVTHDVISSIRMIQSFKDEDTAVLFQTRKSRRWQSIEVVALRKLDMIQAAVNLTDLRVPPGNRLEALSGDLKGQHSIRINDKYRICFVWNDLDGAHEVEIVDYHD